MTTSAPPPPVNAASRARYREIGPDRLDEAVAKGFRAARFFPHRFYLVPKCGPDGLKTARRMCGAAQPDECWEVLLYAEEPVRSRFPDELYFDDDLIWHQQQYGRAGHVASANVLRRADDIVAMVHLSDLVQRAARRPTYRTQIQNRFKGWHEMLLNSLLQVAFEWDVRTVRSPTAALALAHTDRKRHVQAELFDRLYDRDVQRRFDARRDGQWWVIDVAANRQRAVLGRFGSESLGDGKVICLAHDIERGLGHVGIDEALVERADRDADRALDAMLAIERRAGIRATYNVVGCLLPEVRARVAAGGHGLAFHSFDHRVAKPQDGSRAPTEDVEQLRPCRHVDYRLKGYRAPRSVITAELSGDALCYWNFEWLASSARSFGFAEPRLRNRVAHVPVHLDDFGLYQRRVSFAEWERRAIEQIEAQALTVIGLHDCYADFWLPHYADFLDRIGRLGALCTLDAVAARLMFQHAA